MITYVTIFGSGGIVAMNNAMIVYAGPNLRKAKQAKEKINPTYQRDIQRWKDGKFIGNYVAR